MKYTLQHQTGAVLVVSMVMLVAITMLGVTSMKGSLTELTMAGNLRESSLTFQAAEAGLHSAETIVETSSLAEFDGSSSSMLSEGDLDPDYLDADSWANATDANIDLKNIANKPKYIIRYLGQTNTNSNADLKLGDGYSRDRSGLKLNNFRVTSRGSGQTGNFFRVVQSYYAVEAN